MRPIAEVSWLVGLVSFLAGGCGSDAATGSAERFRPVATEWKAGDRLGVVLFDEQRVDPATLMPGECAITAHFGLASADGTVAIGAEEGACVRTSAVSWSGSEASLTPRCAGGLGVEIGTSQRNLTVCDDERFSPPIAVPCEPFGDAALLRVASRPSELMEAELRALDVRMIPVVAARIATPARQGSGTALWPEGSLRVEWEPTGADGVELVLRATAGGDAVRCAVSDRGDFTFPDALIADLRAATASLELASLRIATENADGFEVRVAHRRNDAIQLFRR